MKALEKIINGLDADAVLDLTRYLRSFVNDDRAARIDRVLGRRTSHLTVVLEDIYYPYNASAVVRTCECFGVQHLHAVESSNSFEVNRAIVRGAAKWMTLHRYRGRDGTRNCLRGLRDSGYRIVAMSLDPDCVPLGELDIDTPLALCFGSEEPGLTQVAMDMADVRATIPMQGFTQSLNLSVSAAIAVERLADGIRGSGVDWRLDPAECDLLRCLWLARSIPTGSRIVNRYFDERSRE